MPQPGARTKSKCVSLPPLPVPRAVPLLPSVLRSFLATCWIVSESVRAGECAVL